jgi:pimeloyl-ACP methyl ester carboxylesterase
MTNEPFAATADVLADGHTVVTYDPRGLGRSTVDDPAQDVTPDIEADDLAALIDAVGGGAADVFGSSGGAVAGLALVARHPDRVRTLIAHEPPVTELLPDADPVRAAVDDVENTYRQHGSGAAWGKFISLVVHSGLVPETGVPPISWPPPGSQQDDSAGETAEGNATDDSKADDNGSDKDPANDELFFLHMLKPFTRYQPPVELIASASPRVVVAVGATSGEEIARRSAIALAERIGSAAVTFPGDHGGFMGDPAGFAAAIQRALDVAEIE